MLWVADADGVVSFRDVAPAAGPPPEPPLARMGPSFAGGLSGLIREEDGRLAIRLTPLVPPEDDTRPWRCPLVDPGRVPLGAGARRDAAARTRSRTRCSARSDARSRTCRGPEAPVRQSDPGAARPRTADPAASDPP